MLKTPPLEIRYKDDTISLSIRPLEEKDAEVIVQAVHASIDTLLPFMEWAHGEINVESQRARIIQTRENYFKGEGFEQVVFDGNTGEFLMSSGWHLGKTPSKTALAIGYWTTIEHCNKGLATLVTKILTIAGFEYMKADRIEIWCNKQNHLSRRVIAKCGFHFEGEVRNYFMAPTPAMLSRGCSPERSCLQYALIPEDVAELPWYRELQPLIHVL